MKKFVFLFVFFIMLINVNLVSAQDVWVDHWNYENVDIYVMNDTITIGKDNDGYRWFKVITKEVKNNELIKTIKWSYGEMSTEWRYETSEMDGMHTNHVTKHDKVFQYCMKYLGWSYTPSW